MIGSSTPRHTTGVISSSPRKLNEGGGIGPVGLTCRPRHTAFQESPPDAALRLPDIRTNISRTDSMLISADAKLVQVERDHLGRDDHMFMYSHYKVPHRHPSSSSPTKSPRTTTTTTMPRDLNHNHSKTSSIQHQSPTRRPHVSSDKLASLLKTKDSLDAVARGSSRRRTAAAGANSSSTRNQEDGGRERNEIVVGVDRGGGHNNTTSDPTTTSQTAVIDYHNSDDSNLKATLSTFYASVEYNGGEDGTGGGDGGVCGDGGVVGGGAWFDAVPEELCGVVKPMPTQRAYNAYTQSSAIVTLLWEQFDAKLLALPHSSLLGASSSRPLITAQVPAARVLQAPSILGSLNPAYNNTIDLKTGGGNGEEPAASFSLKQDDDEGGDSTPTAPPTTSAPTTDMPIFNPSMAIESSPSGVEEDLVDWLVLESVLEKAGVVENYTFSEITYTNYDGVGGSGGTESSSSPIIGGSSSGSGGGVDLVKTFHYEGPPVRGVLASKRIQLLQRLWCSTRDSALVGI